MVNDYSNVSIYITNVYLYSRIIMYSYICDFYKRIVIINSIFMSNNAFD